MTQVPGSTFHDTLAQVFIKARAAMLPHERSAGDARLVAWFDGIEDTLTALTGPLLAPLLDHPDVPDEIKALVRPGAAPEQANELSVILIIASALIFPLVQGFLAPAARAAENAGWSIPGNDVMPLSPAEVALSMVRHNPNVTDHYGEAAKSGVAPGHLDALAYNTGESISLQDALLLYRRGQIDETRLITALRQSRVRDEWLPEILDLRYAPVSAGEAIAGALKQRITVDDARTKVAQAGIDPTNFDWLLATAGRPYGIEQALSLWNRGLINEARVRDVIAHSDVNPTYTDDILNLRVYLPPPRSIVAMLRSGAVSDAEATTLLEQHGVPANLIALFLNEAHHSTTQQARDLTQAQTLRFYGAALISRADAQQRLTLLHYDATTIGLLLDYEDNARLERYMNAVVTRTHARYVAYKITRAQATAALGADGITGAAATQLLDVWDIERSIDEHTVTVAEVVHAYRQGMISPAETKQRLVGLGVAAGDLAIVVTAGYPPATPNAAAVAAVVNA